MKTSHLNARPTVLLAAFLAALGLTSLAPKPARAATPESTGEARSAADATPLQWNFEVGHAFRIHEKSITLFTDSSNNRYRNEVELVYVWRVTDVTPDGTATLVVTPESVKIQSQLPLAEFHATPDDSAIALTEEATWRAQFFEAREGVEAGLTCRVTNKGQVIAISSALPAAESFRLIGFTPDVFVRLPRRIVQFGDCWDVAGSQDARVDGSLPVSAHYCLAECWRRADPGEMIHIEGSITSSSHNGHQSAFGPMISVSHFDPIDGYFLDRITVTSGQISTGPDEIVTVRFSTIRQVTKVAELPVVTATQLPNPLHQR